LFSVYKEDKKETVVTYYNGIHPQDDVGTSATFLTDKGIPITVGLLNFQGMFTTNWPMLTAAICIVMLPLFLIFLFLQKYFVAGLTNGGIKG